MATAANVYLLLYPQPALLPALDEQGELLSEIWQGLRAIAPEVLLGEGRVYGGGLCKLEPRELARVPLDAIDATLPRT